MAVKHAFTNPKSDGGDTTVTRPSDWNANHTIDNDTITEAQLSTADNTTKDVSTSKHGFTPKISGSDGYVLTKSGSSAVWSAASGGVTAAPDLKGFAVYPFTSTNAASITITAQASGTRLLLVVGTRNDDVTSVSCTNVTWTQAQGWNSSTATYLSVYVGVATGTTGTTITVNVGGTNYVFASVVYLDDALTPTTGNQASFTGTASTNRKLPLTIDTTPGEIFVMAYTTSDASNAISNMEASSPFFWVPDDSLCGLHLLVGKAVTDHVTGWYDGGNGSNIIVGLVGIS